MDDFDIERFRLPPDEVDKLIAAGAAVPMVPGRRPASKKMDGPFLVITVKDIIAGGSALRDRRMLVWLYIKNQVRKEGRNDVAIGNRNLKEWGVSKQTKLRALQDLGRAGLIAIDWRDRGSPVVTVL